MCKVIAVASGKGGTGKTTTVAAISSCLAALGYKTLCIDFDYGLRNLDLSLCMVDYTIADFADVVSGRLSLMDACCENELIKGLFFLSAPGTFGSDGPGVEEFRPMFDEIRHTFDYCLIDTPSGIGKGFRFAHLYADMSIIVTTGEIPAIRDAQQAVSVAHNLGVKELRLLVNRINRKNFKWLRLTVDDVINKIGVRLLGIVPEDKAVFQALHANTPLVLFSKRLAVYDFLDAARRITGEDVPLRLR